MDPVSMTTRSLRDILHRAAERDLGFRVCVADDVLGPGGRVYIRARAELTERHLAWLEQRNPSRASTPTYVDVVFVQYAPLRSLATEVSRSRSEPPGERQRRAEAVSRQVRARAEDVARQAQEVFRIVGAGAFTAAALRNPRVRAGLQALGQRIRQFHAVVRDALEEYLGGNALIMDLISEYGLGARDVQHGLSAAVLATEVASQVVVEAPAGNGVQTAAEARRLLAEVFLGGFLHDCGLWAQPVVHAGGHAAAGAALVHALPQLHPLAPDLGRIILFHGEALPLASRTGLVEVVEEQEQRAALRAELYGTAEEAQAALRQRPGSLQTHVLGPADLVKVVAVALAEHFLTHSEGFEAQTPPAIIARMAREVRSGVYERCLAALCNVESVVPRRAWARLDGGVSMLVEDEGGARRAQRVDLQGYEAGSIGHADDYYSPHLIVLFAVAPDGSRTRLDYVDPRESSVWRHAAWTGRRLYLAAGRHRDELHMTVTGFMSEDVYVDLLGEYEDELKRQMQA
ncbi:MAG: hypothetical protein AB1505_04275 [Candidatus Latescibacterota bacterium]